MKKIFLVLTLFAAGMSYGQIYTKWGLVNATVNPDGNVGIGIDNPSDRLTLVGNINALPFSGQYSRIGFNIQENFPDLNNVTIANYGMSYSQFDGPTNGPTVSLSGWNGINFYTDKKERMRINGAGNVGIGEINPSEKLSVVGNINAINPVDQYSIIGFNIWDKFSNSGTNNIPIANYGMSQSRFDGLSNGPTISLSGWNGVNFYTNTTERMRINGSGKVGIGITSFPTNSLYSNYKLFVTGGILTDEIRVNLSSGGTWADYVFNKDYNLKPLKEVENYIKDNGHLPNVPSAAQVREEGINVAEMARIQQEKIEELMLYIIAQNKRIEALESKIGK